MNCTEPGKINCTDGSGCYVADQLCDKYANCDDGEDEEDCEDACLAYLDSSKICDSYKDCPEGEDEKGRRVKGALWFVAC